VDLAHGSSLGDMCDYNVLVVHFVEEVCKLIDVHMSAGLGPAGMLAFIERALSD